MSEARRGREKEWKGVSVPAFLVDHHVVRVPEEGRKLVAVLQSRSHAQGVRVRDQPLGVNDAVVERVEAAVGEVGRVDDHVCMCAREETGVRD